MADRKKTDEEYEEEYTGSKSHNYYKKKERDEWVKKRREEDEKKAQKDADHKAKIEKIKSLADEQGFGVPGNLPAEFQPMSPGPKPDWNKAHVTEIPQRPPDADPIQAGYQSQPGYQEAPGSDRAGGPVDKEGMDWEMQYVPEGSSITVHGEKGGDQTFHGRAKPPASEMVDYNDIDPISALAHLHDRITEHYGVDFRSSPEDVKRKAKKALPYGASGKEIRAEEDRIYKHMDKAKSGYEQGRRELYRRQDEARKDRVEADKAKAKARERVAKYNLQLVDLQTKLIKANADIANDPEDLKDLTNEIERNIQIINDEIRRESEHYGITPEREQDLRRGVDDTLAASHEQETATSQAEPAQVAATPTAEHASMAEFARQAKEDGKSLEVAIAEWKAKKANNLTVDPSQRGKKIVKSSPDTQKKKPEPKHKPKPPGTFSKIASGLTESAKAIEKDLVRPAFGAAVVKPLEVAGEAWKKTAESFAKAAFRKSDKIQVNVPLQTIDKTAKVAQAIANNDKGEVAKYQKAGFFDMEGIEEVLKTILKKMGAKPPYYFPSGANTIRQAKAKK